MSEESSFHRGATANATGAPVSGRVADSFGGARARGAVDLSALSSQGAPQSASGTSSETFAAEADASNLQDIIQLSVQVPVVFALYAGYSQQSTQTADMLARLVNSYVGRIFLARANIEAVPQLAQAFSVQGVPAVVAVVKGQPVPLFNGTVPEAEARRYLDELLKVAQANGVSGTLGDENAQIQEAELPPLHQQAIDAIESGDFAAARSAYEQALKEQPSDHDAKAGLAQVGLLERTVPITAEQGQQARDEAATRPDDLQANLAVADLDMAGGHVEDALNRLVAFIAGHPAVDKDAEADRNTARVRLLELFEVVGATDPRVVKARQALARALF